MKILFKPTKKWWEFWKTERFLEKGVDYELTNDGVVLMRALKGEMEVTYNHGK